MRGIDHRSWQDVACSWILDSVGSKTKRGEETRAERDQSSRAGAVLHGRGPRNRRVRSSPIRSSSFVYRSIYLSINLTRRAQVQHKKKASRMSRISPVSPDHTPTPCARLRPKPQSQNKLQSGAFRIEWRQAQRSNEFPIRMYQSHLAGRKTRQATCPTAACISAEHENNITKKNDIKLIS